MSSPEWPDAAPDRILFRVQPFPLTVVREVSLQLEIDGDRFDLGAGCRDPGTDGPPCQLLFPCNGCRPNGLSVEIETALLRRLADARDVRGEALGFPFRWTAEDVRAVAALAKMTGVIPDTERHPARRRGGTTRAPDTHLRWQSVVEPRRGTETG